MAPTRVTLRENAKVKLEAYCGQLENAFCFQIKSNISTIGISGCCATGLTAYLVVCFTGVVWFLTAQKATVKPTNSQTSLFLIAVCI